MFSQPHHNIEQFMIGNSMKVADFGVGSGHYAIEAAKAVGSDGAVYAIDIQKGLLTHLKNLSLDKRLSNIHLICGDLEKIGGSKLKDSSCDAGLVTNILFQIENKEVFAKEVSRVIKKGGKLLVVDWTDSFGGLGPHAKDIVKEEIARKLFEENGFSVEKVIYAGEHHYGLILRKL